MEYNLYFLISLIFNNCILNLENKKLTELYLKLFIDIYYQINNI